MMSELMDIVDKNDNVIGRETRQKIHNSDMWHRGVHVFLFNNKNELLLQLRSPKKDKFPNRWDCSLSEHVSINETYEEAAKRGLLEELNVKTKLKSLIHFRMGYGPGDNTIARLFECQYIGELKMDKEEIVKLKFFNENELKKMLIEKPETFTPWFVEQLKWKFNIPNKLEIF